MTIPDPDLGSISNIAMMAHTASVSNSAELRVHREECAATRLRNEQIFSGIRQDIRGIDQRMADSSKDLAEKVALTARDLADSVNRTATNLAGKMDERHDELKRDVNASNKYIYMIIGGITLAGAVFSHVKLPF